MKLPNVNIKDISRLAGVSVTTVSRTINNPDSVKEDTRNKVLDVIRTYNYVPNNSARNLKRNQSNTLCVLVKGVSNPFLNEMVGVVQKKCLEYGYSMILQQIDQNQDELDVAIEQMKEKRLMGLFFLGGTLNNQRNKLCSLSIPLVMVASNEVVNIRSDQYSSVTINDRKAAFNAVNYLCGLDHKKIGIIISERGANTIMQQRLCGYMDALAKNGISYSEELVANAKDFSAEGGYSAFLELKNRVQEMTAVFCISDTLAIGCMRAARDCGYCLPDNLSVVGFDGIDMARYYYPSITTMRQPYRQMAYKAVEIMHNLLNGKENKHLLFEAEIIEGESCMKNNGDV